MFRRQAAEAFIAVALAVALLPLLFAAVATGMGALRLADAESVRQVVARDLGAKAAQAGMIMAIISFGAAWFGGFARFWSRSVLALALAVAGHIGAAYII